MNIKQIFINSSTPSDDTKALLLCFYLPSVPAAEKLDEQLFFVHNESAPDDTPSKMDEAHLERLSMRRRKRPLKTDMYLQPISAVEGFPVRKRRVVKKHKQLAEAVERRGKDDRLTCDRNKTGGVCAIVDSSSDDEELDKSASYTEIRRQQSAKLKSQAKRNPPKPVHKTVIKDLWADGE